ncbi:glycosyl transferase [Luteimicrobium album]|uniref:Glycosyl transferase n=1 Tax=Luteimicrobium album TaxID=1054550 RepID=A0ABQ6I3A2_9MICO|nr:CDP-glycerol glycerophosphotransferase family protein [Luteimicrobium album]GMA25092.1 glycosyl transferase [Luteimicrobium album]
MVVTADSRTARAIRAETPLRVVTVARYATLDDVYSRSDVRLALYVNHNPDNFSMLRFASMVHVSLLHGDSDKIISVSNQAKAYDFSFVAGQAAVDRLDRYLPRFDAPARTVIVGRPQLETPAVRPPVAPGARATVLYAPTWEGAQPTAAYGSVATHGLALVERLLDDGGFDVVYRPHPLSGVRDAAYGEADATIRERLARAAEAQPQAGHRVSGDESLAEAFAAADVLVCDVSAVAMDWLPNGRPLVVTVPTSTETVTASTRLLDTVPRLAVADVAGAAGLLRAELEDDPGRDARHALLEYYLGDTTPGASMAAFVTACERMIALADSDARVP